MKRTIIFSILLALVGTNADAAVIHHHAAPKKSRVAAIHRMKSSAPHRQYVRVQPGAGYGFAMSYLFGVAADYGVRVPVHHLVRARGSHRTAPQPYEAPSDVSSPPVDSGSSSAAIDSSNAIQAANDEAALNASTAAAEQQNEAAQAAAQQTENNANN